MIESWRIAGDQLPPVVVPVGAALAAKLNELAVLQKRSVPAAIHQALVAHTSGRLGLARLRSRGIWGPQTSADSAQQGAEEIPLPQGHLAALDVLAAAAAIGLPDYTALAIQRHVGGMLVTADLSPTTQNTAGQRGTVGPYSTDDVFITVWLPVALADSLAELGGLLDLGQSDLLRNLVFEGLHGRLGYRRALSTGLWSVARRGGASGIMDSEQPAEPTKEVRPLAAARTLLIEQLGKSTAAFKVWVPALLRAELDIAANARGLRRSEFLRRLLAVALIGRTTFDALPLTPTR